MRRFFNLYQFAAPLVLLPIAWFLWMDAYERNWRFVVLVLSLPIVASYVLPGLGTNVFQLWEFHTRFRLGRFRPQHGFVFGTATSLLTYACLENVQGAIGIGTVLRSGLIVGTTIGFFNWYYDFLAVEAGFITYYNRSWFEGRGPEAVVTEYAPVYFGMHGLVLGMEVRVLELLLLQHGRWDLYPWLALGCHAILLVVPTAAFLAYAKLRTGESGLKSYRPPDPVPANSPSTSTGSS